MKILHASKFKRVVLVCAECEDRSNGPRHLRSKSAVKELRRLAADAPERTRVMRSRCLDLCPRKALAAMALGEGLAKKNAFMQDEDDVHELARYAFGFRKDPNAPKDPNDPNNPS